MKLLYKYLPAKGAIALLKKREFWFRCPLQFEPWDCRADLLQYLDVGKTRQALRNELTRLLCNQCTSPTPIAPMGYLFHSLWSAHHPWTEQDIDSHFGTLVGDALGNLEAHRNRIRGEVDQLLQDVRVLSLCEDCHSKEMWDRYADKGSGVCIGFRYVPELDNVIGAARRVEYVSQWPLIATPLEWARHLLLIEEIPFGRRAVDALFVKQVRFKHEREWRIITKPKPGSRADSNGVLRVTIDPPEISEINLGSSLSVQDCTEIHRVVRAVYPHVDVRNAVSAPAEIKP